MGDIRYAEYTKSVCGRLQHLHCVNGDRQTDSMNERGEEWEYMSFCVDHIALKSLYLKT